MVGLFHFKVCEERPFLDVGKRLIQTALVDVAVPISLGYGFDVSIAYVQSQNPIDHFSHGAVLHARFTRLSLLRLSQFCGRLRVFQIMATGHFGTEFLRINCAILTGERDQSSVI